MAENKSPADKAAAAEEVERLRAENESLRGQLAAAGAPRGVGRVPAPKPYLTEGERQDLITFGVTTNVHTGQRMNLHQAAELYPDVDLSAASDAATAAADRDQAEAAKGRPAIRGVDFVYPSVAPGQIDPAVAGAPGINGPAAGQGDKA